MTFDMSIIENVYDWCRALAMSFIIDGYCFRPYKQYIPNSRYYVTPHMDKWNHEEFTKIVNAFN